MKKRFSILTYGCQMNVYDSLKIQELLGSIGFSDSSSFFDADLIILNTCHIREKATEKVYSELGKIKKSFKNDIEFGRKIIAVMGCVAQAEGDEIFKRTPYVDIVIGSQSVHNLPTLVTEAMERKNKRKSLKLIDVDFPARNKFNYFKHNKPQGASAYITIQEGCDKFCNFCVVPYTRGEEFSRPIEDVYVEANNLVALGSREIILLGQNVTAYHGKDFSGKEQGIHKLIEKLAKIKDLRRIRYITSHPLDIDQNIISIHGTEKKLMPFLHLPIQSGSNKILRSMNRKYTVEDYISIVKKFRVICPDIQFSSDFIVGYPGESEQDFQATIRLVKK
ncbi:MAG TPA: tRNA (N6-isopentenyl adenosine(37)-C2)-methylthiotransferase MiaB, partial [Alphaproteobacteria bacterium]|nr:tRNA (N6-isopentenyl adenosine(37)-C2)-methylthiotransferase MiaB [Alphaproteobacteria bacterium]